MMQKPEFYKRSGFIPLLSAGAVGLCAVMDLTGKNPEELRTVVVFGFGYVAVLVLISTSIILNKLDELKSNMSPENETD